MHTHFLPQAVMTTATADMEGMGVTEATAATIMAMAAVDMVDMVSVRPELMPACVTCQLIYISYSVCLVSLAPCCLLMSSILVSSFILSCFLLILSCLSCYSLLCLLQIFDCPLSLAPCSLLMSLLTCSCLLYYQLCSVTPVLYSLNCHP